MPAPNNTYFGDIDGDGNDDFIMFRNMWGYVAKTNFEGSGVIATRLDNFANISRLVVGNFRNTSGVPAAREEICAIMTDNFMTCHTMGASNKDLEFLNGFWAPFAADEHAIVGDFDGNGLDDILAYKPSTGGLRMFSYDTTNNTFVSMSNFDLGNLDDGICGTTNVQIRAGEFGQTVGRDDLAIVHPNGVVCRFDSATDGAGIKTFWWAFNTTNVVGSNEDFAIANIDGNSQDDLVMRDRTTGAWRFRQMHFGDGSLVPITSVSTGQLPTTASSQVFWVRNRGGLDASSLRDDSMVYRSDIGMWVSTHGRWSGTQNTYWWAYTQSRLDLTADQDGDAILTGNELGGYDENGDGFSDEALQTYGTAAFVKDILVEMDFMGPAMGETDNLALRPAAINRAIADMARFGINLHVITGNQVAWQQVLGGASNFNWVTHFDPIKDANFAQSRRRFFHYMLSAESYRAGGTTGSSGLSRDIPATDLIVTLGSWAGNGTNDEQAGTLLHELGHNLGFFHGGHADNDFNNKKNFLSVMNYDYQMIGVRKNATQQMNYSELVLENLNENSLNEGRGVVITSGGVGSTFATLYNGIWEPLGRGTSFFGIDWNQNGSTNGTVSFNINGDTWDHDSNPMTPPVAVISSLHKGGIDEYAITKYSFSGSIIGTASAPGLGGGGAGGVPQEDRSKPKTKKPHVVIPFPPMSSRAYAELTEDEYVKNIKPKHGNLPAYDYTPYERPVPEHQPLELDPKDHPNKSNRR